MKKKTFNQFVLESKATNNAYGGNVSGFTPNTVGGFNVIFNRNGKGGIQQSKGIIRNQKELRKRMEELRELLAMMYDKNKTSTDELGKETDITPPVGYSGLGGGHGDEDFPYWTDAFPGSDVGHPDQFNYDDYLAWLRDVPYAGDLDTPDPIDVQTSSNGGGGGEIDVQTMYRGKQPIDWPFGDDIVIPPNTDPTDGWKPPIHIPTPDIKVDTGRFSNNDDDDNDDDDGIDSTDGDWSNTIGGDVDNPDPFGGGGAFGNTYDTLHKYVVLDVDDIISQNLKNTST
jgi:hypothetical protein